MNFDPKALPLMPETYLMGRDRLAPLTAELEANMKLLLVRVNGLFTVIFPEIRNLYCGISSGYRPDVVNSLVSGAAKFSAHRMCMAVDCRDPKGELAKILLSRLDILEQAQLFMEDPRWTRGSFGGSGWVHLQTRIAHRRVFIPFSGPPPK